MSICEIAPGKWDVSNEEYHADRECVSSSALKEFLDWVPTYHQRYVLGTLPRKEPTDSMVLGSAIHCAILETEKYNERYCVAPVCDRRTTAGKNAWAEFVQGNQEKIILTADQRETINGVTKSFSLHEICDLLNGGSVEQSFRWQDPSTDIWCKCRPDFLRDDGLIIDLKTVNTLSPKKLLAQAAELRYHMQAAFYLDGIQLTTGARERFIHVALCTSPPYGVVVYELGTDSLNHGRFAYQAALQGIADCRESGEWNDPNGTAINKWELPVWALRGEI